MKVKKFFFVLALSFLIFASPAMARESEPPERFEPFKFSTLSGSSRPSSSPRVEGEDRLEDKRLKFCENHQEEIKNRFGHLGNLVSLMFGKFDAIAKSVEDYYNNKLVPSGKTLSNYDALVVEIATKRAAVETALANTESDITDFSCTADNPKGQIRQYRIDMQTVKKALHEYRTSIKNLIVATRTIAPKESPEPTETPEPSPTP